MKKRNANIIFNKNGNGFISTKIALPVPWTKELGFNENDRQAIITIENNKIIIEKGEFKMYRVNKNYEVYRKDIFEKHGAKEYHHYDDANSVDEGNIAEFASKKEAIEYAKKYYNELRDDERVSISGNQMYFIRIDVLDYENDDDPVLEDSFGLSLEEYEKKELE